LCPTGGDQLFRISFSIEDTHGYVDRVKHPSAVRTLRPAAVMRTLPTVTNLLPARTFSRVKVANPRLISPAIMLMQNPCAISHVCEEPLRPALASTANARRCSAVRLIGAPLVGFPATEANIVLSIAAAKF
jgi:hypothetical protein